MKRRNPIAIVVLLSGVILGITSLHASGEQVTYWKALDLSDRLVYGLSNGNPSGVFGRLSPELRDKVRKPVWVKSLQPSGGRISFVTDAPAIRLRAQFLPDQTSWHHMPRTMQFGFDLYVNGKFFRNLSNEGTGYDFDRVIELQAPRGNNEIKLYLPLYSQIENLHIFIPTDARYHSPKNDPGKHVIWYGTSLTQGCCTSNPGMSYPAIIARHLDHDFLNLGFDGNGSGEPEVAEVIAQLDTHLFILDYWANTSLAGWENTLPQFIRILRKAHPRTPIVIITPLFNNIREEADDVARRSFAFQYQERLGDDHLHVVDGMELLGSDDAAGSIDGIHLNALGHWMVATRLSAQLQEKLPTLFAPN